MSHSFRARPSSWPYRADPPQRYWGNYLRYQRRGGLIDLENDAKDFAAGGQLGDISRFYFFCLAFDQIQKEELNGDLAELGVFQGHTATLIARMARRLGRTAYLLDTFEGFDPVDFYGLDSNKKMQFTETSLEAVRRVVGDENVQFLKGHFPGTASALPDTCYCMVHIDCDLCAPVTAGLEYFYPRLVPGGFLIIHDYSSLNWDGAERAVDEFFSDKTECIIPLTDGAGSVVVRKARDEKGNWLAHKRCSRFTEAWVSASGGNIADLLGAGWSEPEDWGIWAVGTEHEINLTLSVGSGGDVILEADVHAPLMGSVQEQAVTISTGEEILAEWLFTPRENRGVRSVGIPARLVRYGSNPTIRLVLRPRVTVTPAQLGRVDDERPLSFAVHRIRRG